MPVRNKNKNNKTRRSRGTPPPKRVNQPRKQTNASQSIVRGLSGIANQFMPGAGLAITGVSKLLGFGAYTNEDANRMLASKVPDMHATLDRGVRIAHHEYLGDVLSSIAFSSRTYPLNPGQAVTFPWLSTVAAAFQEYELNGAVFFFKSTSANALNSINTALGQVIGAVQYNPYQSAPNSKLEMLALAGSADGKPSESNIYPVECKSDMTIMRSKLIRTTPVTDDLAKYDHGNFFLGTNGSQAEATIGELHIVYDVWLKKPKLLGPGAAVAWYSHFVAATPTPTSPLGSTPGTIASNSLGVLIDRMTNKVIIPSACVVAGTKYRMRVMYSGTTAAAVAAPSLTLNNAANNSDVFYRASTTAVLAAPGSGSSDVYIWEVNFKVQASNTPVILTFGTNGVYPTSTAVADFVITETAEDLATYQSF